MTVGVDGSDAQRASGPEYACALGHEDVGILEVLDHEVGQTEIYAPRLDWP